MQMTVIDFAAPPLGEAERQISDPYRSATTPAVTFTVAAQATGTEVTGLVKNSATSVCVEPADANQVLGSGRANFPNGAIGYGTSAIRAEFATPLSAPTQVEVDFQTGAGVSVRLRLFDANGAEITTVADTANPAAGTCGFPGQARAKKRLTAQASQPVAYAIMDLGAATGRFVFTIDNFAFGPPDDPTGIPTPNTADLGLITDRAPIQVTVGQLFTYTVEVTNQGPRPATQAVVTSTLSSGATLLSARSTQATCGKTLDETGAAPIVVCTLTTLPPSQSAQIHVGLLAHANQTGQMLHNRAWVQNQAESDPNPDNNAVVTAFAVTSTRVITGLQALYTFAEPVHTPVYDLAGGNRPLHLQVQDEGHVHRSIAGLQIVTPTLLASQTSAFTLTQAIRTSDALSLEAWVAPAAGATQTPATLFVLGSPARQGGVQTPNLWLLQEPFAQSNAGIFTAHLLTSDPQGLERLSATPADAAFPALLQLVFTRAATGATRLYINGVERGIKATLGNLSAWDAATHLYLGATADGVMPWLGQYRLVALYDRALTPAEVMQNYKAGPQEMANPPAPSADDLFGFEYEIWSDPSTPVAQTPVRLGVVVHRQGGLAVLSNITVRFYHGNPAQGGEPIGDVLVEHLSPRGASISTDLFWQPPTAGVYTLYVEIDPENEIPERDETNNQLVRQMTVVPATLPPDQDVAAPHVDAFAINDNSPTTTTPTVTLNVSVSDPLPGAGVQEVIFVEHEYAMSAAAWRVARISGWLAYPQTPTIYRWRLQERPGLKYLQAWARDGAGNISLFPYTRYINYAPPVQTMPTGGVQMLRYPLHQGDLVTIRLEPISGDPDLYVWPPDTREGRPPWVSNLRQRVDAVAFTAPVEGLYQIEVYAFTVTEYRLTIAAQPQRRADLALTDGGIDPTKPLHSAPWMPVESAPSSSETLPLLWAQGHQLFLPMIVTSQ